mgnify:FL=1
MGTTVYGKAVFPLNAGKKDTDILEATAQNQEDFDYGSHAARTTQSYLSVSVNPTIVQNNLQYENSVSGSSLVNSANFMEIRDTSHGGGISNDYADKIGNRVYPGNNTLTSYATNRDETHSFKVKLYDSQVANSETNRKFVYSTSDYPATEEVGLDIENYDYFILLNPDTYQMGTDALRPHFAKVTRIISFDEFGDGLEFSPAYPTEIPINTKLEVYKGPAKTATSVVAVSYGLRGDTSTSTPKHDRVAYCSRPTWYFYKDRLDEKDQLDYMTKYNLTHLRWWNYPTTLEVTSVDAHAQYEAGSGSKEFTLNDASDDLKLSIGMSVFNASNVFLGNITNITPLTNKFRLDYARIAITGTNTNFNISIGKTTHNVAFRTEGKFGNIIHSLGKNRMEATLVDSNRTSDDSNSSNFYKWETAFPKMHRHTANSDSVTGTTLDGNMTGPGKYITFEKANFKNNRIPLITDATLNQPRNKMSQLARFKILDNSGLQHLKVQEEADLVLERNIHNDSLNLIAFEGKAARNSSNTSIIMMSDIKKSTELRNILGNNDIIEIDGYQYVVASVAAQSGGKQAITIKDKKLKTANVWSGSAVAENFSEKTLYLTPYTGVINTTLEPDTEYDYTTGRISMSDVTVDKEKTKLYNARLVNGTHNGHDNKIDYGDKDNKFLKMQDSDRVFYQRSNENASRFYYYSGGYAISDTAFRGIVEDVSSVSENGLTTYHVVGRDETSKLLSQTVTKNTKFMDDVLHTSLPPYLDATAITGTSNLSLSGALITWSGTPSITPTRHGLVLNQAGELIGEVKQYEANYTSTYDRITCYNTLYSTPTTTTSLLYYHPYESTWTNLITGTKALSSNKLHDTGLSGFTSISEKGLGFNGGLSVGGTFSANASTFTHSNLKATSNTGNYQKDRTLGYDISSPKSISTDDSIFAFTVGDENGVSVEKKDIATLSSERFDVIATNEKSEGATTMEIAPTFPVVLGRLNSNNQDSRGNCNIYLINNNIDTGGFIHRLQDSFTGSGYYGPKETIRYWDLQKFKAGTIQKNSKSIYSEGNTPQQIQGYAVGYGVKSNGATFTPTVTPNNKPINGSNTLKGWNHLTSGGFYASDLIESYTYGAGGTTEFDIQYDAFEQIDPKADNYELLAVGDLFPYSKLRHNNLGYHTKNYDDFSIILETDNSNSGTTIHEDYIGKTSSTLVTENMTEESSISSATQTTNQSRRYGVIRLVEATFDWHFNPVDFENLKHTDEIPTLPYFDYVMMRVPTVETASNSITLSNGSDVNVSSGSITPNDGDMFYSKDFIGETPDAMHVSFSGNTVPTQSNGFVAVKRAAAWGGSDSGNHARRGLGGTYDDILRFAGHNDSGVKWYGVTPFSIYRTTDHNIDNLSTSTGIRVDRRLRTKDIRFTNVFITRGNTKTSKFEFANLEHGSDEFDAHNVILPLISQSKETSATDNNLNHTHSLWHHPDSWMGNVSFDGGHMLHMSRVINALVHRTRSSGTGVSIQNKYGLGITSTSDAFFSHPYDNCIALFKDVKLAMEDNTITLPDISLTSSPLGLDTDARYQTYITGLGADADTDQTTRNAMLQPFDGSTDIIMGGTKTTGTFLVDSNSTGTTTREENHHDVGSGTKGLVASAQMLVKPTFNLADSDITKAVSASNNTTTLAFTLNATSNHNWLSFVPNLTGHYLVSERLTTSTGGATDSTIRTKKDGGMPSTIVKVLSHTVSTTPSTSAIEVHTIVLDNNLTTDEQSYQYRLMRISETTFAQQQDFIEFNTLKKLSTAQHFKTGKDGSDNFEFQESVWAMHLLLDIDSGTSEYLEHRTPTTAIDGFTHLEKMRINFTDGENSVVTTTTVSTKKPTVDKISEGFKTTPTVATENGLTMKIEGSVSGNGVVSLGEVFEITLGRKPKLKNIKKCHIGTTYSISSNLEKEVEDIVKLAGLEYNAARSFSTPTGNIISSGTTSSTTITCSANVSGINDGDVLYSYDGHLIGEVATGGVSNAVITLTKKYYAPAQHDEIVKINKKTFVTNLKFDNSNMYNAINSLIAKRGLDYRIKNGEFITRNIEDTDSLRKYALSYKETNRLIKVGSNKSMFDKANKVVVIGDKVQYELEQPSKKQTRAIKVVDPTIKTRIDAETKAVELMEIYNGESRKIDVELQKQGLELLEAGDIVRMNFPNHNIPIGDYIVFEIENVLAGTLKIKVGTFDKTIAERLSELSTRQSDDSTTLLGKDANIISGGKYLFDAIKLKNISFSYTITGSSNALSYNSNMGFDDLVGFTEEVGFEHSVVTKKSYRDRFYEQEDY